MKNIFITLNKVQTHILTWGEPRNCDGTDVVICIAGNPGVPDFYTEFGSLLHENTKLPACVIGQAGHEEVPDKQSNELNNQEHLFNLEGQIEHKVDLITKNIDKKSKLHLIGHSIGSWLILEMLQKNESITERVASVNLLFPTVQRMAETNKGRLLNNVIRKIHALLIIASMIIYLLPKSILTSAVKFYLKFNRLPQDYNERIMKIVHPKVLEKILFLAYNEMDTVKELNIRIIEEIKEKIFVLYSSRDGWVPLHYMEDWRRFEPALKMNEVDIDHAFVLKSSERVAEIVSDVIKNKISSSLPDN